MTTPTYVVVLLPGCPNSMRFAQALQSVPEPTRSATIQMVTADQLHPTYAARVQAVPSVIHVPTGNVESGTRAFQWLESMIGGGGGGGGAPQQSTTVQPYDPGSLYGAIDGSAGFQRFSST